MKNLYFKNLLNVTSAAFIGLVIMIVTNIPIKFLFDNPAESIALCIVCLLASMISLFLMCLRDGYKANISSSKLIDMKTVVSMGLASLTYCIVTVIIRYRTFGAATNISLLAMIISGAHENTGLSTLVEEYGNYMFISMLIQTVPFIPTMAIGYIVGGKRRQKSRREITEKHERK